MLFVTRKYTIINANFKFINATGFELERKCRFAKKFVNFVVRRVYHKYQITLLKTLTNAVFQFPTFCLLGACKSRSGSLQSKPVLSYRLRCNISPQQSNFDDKLRTKVFPSNLQTICTRKFYISILKLLFKTAILLPCSEQQNTLPFCSQSNKTINMPAGCLK